LSPGTRRDHRNAESGKNPFHHVHLLGLMFPGGSPVETDSVSLRFRFDSRWLSVLVESVVGVEPTMSPSSRWNQTSPHSIRFPNTAED
jgi:hypothetical protein